MCVSVFAIVLRYIFASILYFAMAREILPYSIILRARNNHRAIGCVKIGRQIEIASKVNYARVSVQLRLNFHFQYLAS